MEARESIIWRAVRRCRMLNSVAKILDEAKTTKERGMAEQTGAAKHVVAGIPADNL